MKPDETALQFNDWPASERYGDQLDWHLKRGTRPDAKDRERGIRWERKDFAFELGISVQALGKYINHKDRPREKRHIPKLLFGDNPLYADWAHRLEMARCAPLHGESVQAGDLIGVPSKIDEFVGRAQELDRIHSVLKSTDYGPYGNTVVVVGLGGAGKTSLATQYAYDHAGEYLGVWWFSAHARSEIFSGITKFGKYLGIPEVDERDPETSARCAARALSKTGQRWLLVFDNVDDPNDLEGCLPSGGIKCLITTRFSNWPTRLAVIRLEVLSLDDAASLLETIAQSSDRGGALDLAERVLGRLPLALLHAGTTCRLMGLTFYQYAEQAEEFLSVEHRGLSYPNSVSITFTIAIKNAIKHAAAAGRVMSVLAQVSPELIPIRLLFGGKRRDPSEYAALTALIESSLVQSERFEDGTPAIKVHRLVQAVARARAEESGERDASLRRLVFALSTYFPSATGVARSTDQWATCEKYLAHIVALESRLTDEDRILNLDNILDAAALYASMKSRFNEAEALSRRSLSLIVHSRANEDKKNIFTLRLAYSLEQSTRLQEALDTLNSIRDLAKQAGASRSLLFAIFSRTGCVLRALGRLPEADIEFEHASRFVSQSASADRATFLTEMANLRSDQGQYQEAETMYAEALRLKENVFGFQSIDTATALCNLAGCRSHLGEYASSVSLLKRALSIQTREYEHAHPSICLTLDRLGEAAAHMPDNHEWQQFFEDAIKGFEDCLGPDNLSMSMSMNNYANNLSNRGSDLEACDLYKKALEISASHFRDDHQSVLPVISNLGNTLSKLQCFAEAQGYLKRAAEATLRFHGPGHERTLFAHLAFTKVLFDLGRLAEAEKVTSKFKEQFAACRPRNDPDVARLAERHQMFLNSLSDANEKPYVTR